MKRLGLTLVAALSALLLQHLQPEINLQLQNGKVTSMLVN